MAASSAINAKRIGYYLQAHYHYDDHTKYLSMLPLGDPSRHTAYIVLAAFHLNYTKDDGAGLKKIYLNDEIYDEGTNVKVWEEAEQLRAKGIKIFGLLGGDGIWEIEKLGGTEGFDLAYRLVADMIRAKRLDGVDLNVEPHDEDSTKSVGNAGVIKVVTQLKRDFPDLLITMAPGGRELLPQESRLSNVEYIDLYKSIGDQIAWFNVQCYNGWGSPEVGSFQGYIDAGFPADKLVMLVLGGPNTSGQVTGWVDGDTLRDGLNSIIAAYPDMGGICCWDWFNATLDASAGPQLEKWSDFVSSVMYPPAPASAS
jgi:hypothetical protein